MHPFHQLDLLHRRLSLFLFGDSNSSVTIMNAFFTLFFVLVVTTLARPQNAQAFRTFFNRLRFGRSRDSNDETIATTSTTSIVKDDQAEKGPSFPQSTIQWWDDLAPPFGISSDVDRRNRNDDDRVLREDALDDDDDDDEDELDDDDTVFPRSSRFHQPDLDADITHFCFLVHGHRGFSRDLSYLQTRMERTAAHCKRRQRSNIRQDAKDEEEQQSSLPIRHDMVVHAATCNEKKTTDGVRQGGERLVREMLDVIRAEMAHRRNPDITISVLGNSLGGIYSRYAIAKLWQHCEAASDDDMDDAWDSRSTDARDREDDNGEEDVLLLDGRYRLHFNVFCTTATPHLGLAGHTFLPLPRTAEIGVGHALGDTGRDLFRLNDLMKDMATSEEYLEPLGKFRKRVAYANAYGTDFPVPVHTAAFLSEDSEYPHHFYEDSNEEDRLVVDDNGLVVATLHTPPRSQNGKSSEGKQPDNEDLHVNQDDEDELVLMSKSLDSLGWKKVFVDVRNQVPKIGIPKVSNFLSRGSDSSENEDNNNNSNEEADAAAEPSGSPEPSCTTTTMEPIDRLKERGVVGSKDVAAAVSKPLFEQEFHWPMGHNMIVAFSRSRLSTYMNKAGRPVVNSLAQQLVGDIFAFSPPLPTPLAQSEESLETASAADANDALAEADEDLVESRLVDNP